jgi:hypothetical protein
MYCSSKDMIYVSSQVCFSPQKTVVSIGTINNIVIYYIAGSADILVSLITFLGMATAYGFTIIKALITVLLAIKAC